MTEITDGELLDAFAKRRDAAAFEQLVRRHLDWVYSCSNRTVRDADMAEDVAQAVFILMARKAGSLAEHRQLGGWLFRATRYCAANAVKQQIRRREHERKAAAMQAQVSAQSDPNWEEIYPVLDSAMEQLGAADRQAVLLRFYQGMTMVQVGSSMGLGEEAAKKRIQRAVKRLRSLMASKGVLVETGGLATAMAAGITQAAPMGLVQATLTSSAGMSKTTAAGMIAHTTARLMWWAKVKLVALLFVAGTVGIGASYGVMSYELARATVQSSSATTPTTPTALMVPEQPAGKTPSDVFDGLYEKAPGSSPGLSMKVGPNTFTVTAVVRYAADGKALASDGRGKAIDLTQLPLSAIKPSTGTFNDTVIAFLEPRRERYDIKRLRIFDHVARRFLTNVVVTQMPGLSALRIDAVPGTLPPQIDLWLDVASYDIANLPVNLAARKDATVGIGGAMVGFADIRDGQWNSNGKQFTTVSRDTPQTTMQLKSSGNWNAGRYQISAISKTGQKYLSDFFIDLSSNGSEVMFFPFALNDIDHFEMRQFAAEPPFFFDGIDLPRVGALPARSQIPQPTIVDAAGKSSIQLPCGAVVELKGIGMFPPTENKWWGLDGGAVDLGAVALGGTVTDDAGRLERRVFVAGLHDAPVGVSGLLWQIDPAASLAGGGRDQQSSIVAALKRGSSVTIRLGVAAPRWHSLQEIPVDKLPADVTCFPGMIESLRATGDGVALDTAISEQPENVRLVLIDRAGKTHTYNRMSTVSPR